MGSTWKSPWKGKELAEDEPGTGNVVTWLGTVPAGAAAGGEWRHLYLCLGTNPVLSE